jgi:WD40 repeat protein
MCAAFAPDGRRILTGSTDGAARLWDLAGGLEPPTLTNVVCSTDGSQFARVTDGTVELGTPGTDRTRRLVNAPHPAPEQVLLTGDATRLLTLAAGDTTNNAPATFAQLWDCASGRSLAGPWAITPPIQRAILSDDGRVLVALADAQVQAWDVRTGTPIFPPLRHDATVRTAALDAAGRHLVLVVRTNAILYEVRTGRAVWTLHHATDVAHAEFSPDGSRLVTARRDDSVEACDARVWDVNTGQPLVEPLRHRDGVLHAAFSPDGAWIVTASEDRTAQVWSAHTGQRHGPPMRHNHEVACARFSAGGTQVITASQWEHNVRLWQVGTSEPLTPPLPHPWGVAQARFAAQDTCIVTRRATGDTWCLPVLADPRPVPTLMLLARFLSGRSGESSDDVRPFSPMETRQLWHQLRQQFPEDFAVSPKHASAWHEREIRRCESDRAWSAVAFHLEQLRALNPEDPGIAKRLERARARAKASP